MEVKLIPYQYKERLDTAFLKKLFDFSKEFKKIVLLSTVQHLKQINQILSYFSKKDKEIVFGGQVLGCNVSNAKKHDTEVFIFLGTGEFHPIGIARETGKKVIIANPFSKKINYLNEKELKKRNLIKHKFLSDFEDAKNIGLLVSVKSGQQNLEKAKKILKELEKDGKNPNIFLFNTLVPEELDNFPTIDFWINFSCPRIEDDFKRFRKPVLNWKEFKE